MEKIVLGMLKRFKREDLRKAIDENIDLLELVEKHVPKEMISIARFLAPFFSNSVDERKVLGWLREVREDFYEEIVRDERSYEWFKNNMRRLLNYFCEGKRVP